MPSCNATVTLVPLGWNVECFREPSWRADSWNKARRLNRHAPRSAQAAPEMRAMHSWREGSREPEKPLILIVEDDIWIRSIAGALLEDEGFATATAADGQAGLSMAERLHPAVILLDLGLPRVSGSEFLRRIRSRAGLQRTPVIVVSGQTETLSDKLATLADGVLRKPVDMAELIEHVCQALGRKRVGLGVASGVRPPKSAEG
jgi:CheY-like chemotaxis protein